MNQLKKYLTINSAFSLFTGLIMLIFSKALNSFFHVDHAYAFPIIGVNLIIFSLFVWYVSRKQIHNKSLVYLISALDALWVLGSFAIIAFNIFELSKNGYYVIAIIAIWIGFLGYQQYRNA